MGGMSFVSIFSDRASKAEISARSPGASGSELPFFIGFPFLWRCFTRTDDAPDISVDLLQIQECSYIIYKFR
jgi:hypothetical protein